MAGGSRRAPGVRWATLVVALLVASSCALVVRSTVDGQGGPTDGSSREPGLSEDGRFLAFTSSATDLVTSDANGEDDVFRRDHQGGTTQLVSVGVGGAPANGASWSPAVSATGRYVAFVSAASNLVSGDTNGVEDVFVRDLAAGTTERVSIGAGGGQLSDASGVVDCALPAPSHCAATQRGVVISGDGQQVAFVSANVSGPVVRWRDRSSATTFAPVLPDPPAGSIGVAFTDLALSTDGTTLAFTEVHAFTSGELAGLGVYERGGNRSWVLEPDPALPAERRSPGDTCCSPDLSADGRMLAFATPIALVAEDDGPGAPWDVDVFLRDRVLATTERVSLTKTGAELDGGAFGPSLSDDAEDVTFWAADPTVMGDGVAATHLYLRDRPGALTQRVSEGPSGVADAPTTGGLSGDGRVAVLASAASNLAGAGALGVTDLFVRLAATPAPTGTAIPVTAGAAGALVTVSGRFLDTSTTVRADGFGLDVDGAAALPNGDLQLTVTAEPGAALGPRTVWFENQGPFGLNSRTACQCLAVAWTYAPPDPAPAHPNVVLIVTDDQRWDGVDDMPGIDARTDWARFTDMYVNEPMCCPSRASILTGRYSHHTTVETLLEGANLDESTTLATMLDGAGYRTGFIGKYLNGYPYNRGPYVPAGWDEWAAYLGPTDYYNYSLFEDGNVVNYGTSAEDYSTDRFTTLARAFLRQTSPSEPFFLYVAPNSPHFASGPALPKPPPRHNFRCSGFSFDPRPNFNGVDTVSEPAWMTGANPQSSSSMALQQLATCRSLLGVDDGVVSIFDELARSGRLDDTYVIVTSDNGYSFGEHRLFGKGHLYEESVRVPLLVRGPDVLAGPQGRLTSNIDLTPTILDWAGVSAPGGFLDGTSFADNLRGDDEIPDPADILLRGCRTGLAGTQACGGYPQEMGLNWGLRTATYKYVEYPSGEVQLFDLTVDPYELTNLADDPEHAAVRAMLAARLSLLRS